VSSRELESEIYLGFVLCVKCAFTPFRVLQLRV
jgi:hypothetical protein